MIHPFWDMALLRVDGFGSSIKPLTLSLAAPEDLIDREVAVVGYPVRGRDFSERAIEAERRYFGEGERNVGVKRLAPGDIHARLPIESFKHMVSAMTHDSSTLPGNSGAAVMDVKTGAIVGLHFGGISFKANYAVPTFELARDLRVVDAGLNFDGDTAPTEEWDNHWKVADPENEMRGSPLAVPGVALPETPQQPSSVRPATTERPRPATPTIIQPATAQPLASSFPISINITIGGPAQAPIITQFGTVTPPTTESPLVLESFQVPVIYPNIETRGGYLDDFIGDRVPLPELTNAGKQAVASLLDGSGYVLKYHHFSVVMHKKRRLALFTAANVNWQRKSRLVDGKKPSRAELTGIPKGVLEEWVTDERMSEDHQLPDIFFTKDKGAFDKGHLVRRDDAAWGKEDDFEDMQKGNGDTYHVTNCSPQVANFNQGNKGADDHNWGDLENMIQRETSKEMVSIFSGPALDPTDRIFKGVTEAGVIRVQIPRQFWKIVVANTNQGPRTYGFILKQILDDVPLEFVVPEDWESYQAPIAEIEKLLFGLVSLKWFKERDALNP
jgi:endonuclease G